MMKCINSTIYKGLISEGISFQLLSTTCCKTHWWRNFLLVVAQLGWSSLRNSFFKQFTHHSLWNCLVTHYKTRLLLGWKIHRRKIYSLRAAKNIISIFILPLSEFSCILTKFYTSLF